MLLDVRLGVTADTRMISLWQQNAPSTASKSCAPLVLPSLKGDQPLLISPHNISGILRILLEKESLRFSAIMMGAFQGGSPELTFLLNSGVYLTV